MTKTKEVKELLLESFENLPEDIRKCEKKILGFSNSITTTGSEMEEIEYFVMAAISRTTIDPTDPESKKVFTNEAGRQSELFKRLKKHKEYLDKKIDINFSKNELAKEKIYLNYLNNKFSACKHITKLMEVRE